MSKESGRPGFESYPTSSCVASGKFLNFSEHGFPVCKNSYNICLGLLSQKVVSLKVCITCSIHPVLSPSPLVVLRDFERSSHPTSTSKFHLKLTHRRKPTEGSTASQDLPGPDHLSGDYIQAPGPLSAHSDPEHLCQPWAALGFPSETVPATLPALYRIPPCALVLITCLWGSFLRAECRTLGTNSLCHAEGKRSPDRKSHVPQFTVWSGRSSDLGP